MKVKLIMIGKTVKSYLKEGEQEYDQRIKHYVRLEETVIPDIKNASKLSKKELKSKEGKMILSKLGNTDEVILLDDKGKEFTSKELSEFLKQKMLHSTKTLVFIVGGAFGFSDEVYARANSKLSLSKMTFSHQMVRMIFKEQLYRAFTIIKGEKYHHE